MGATAGWPFWLAPLLLPQELDASDRYAIEQCGILGIDLMERAGAALADAARAELPAGPIAVLCGAGNNGGDGFIAARLLRDAGREVRVLASRAPHEYEGDAAIALSRLGDQQAIERPEQVGAVLGGATGVIDALLGTGTVGVPRGIVAALISAVRASNLPVVACDLPSGIDAASGTVAGEVIAARCTVTFHRPSPGHLVQPAKTHVGRLIVADIGIPPGAPMTPRCGAIRSAVTRALPQRGAASHKYNAGAVTVVAGAPAYPGAAMLAVRGAQRAGAGYVTAVVSDPAVVLVRGASPEAIVRAWSRDIGDAAFAELLERRTDAVVLGPGLIGTDPGEQRLIDATLAAERPTVLDAGALALYSGRAEELRRGAPLILTPHAGELGRLLGIGAAAVGAQRLASAHTAAQRTGAVVVLKGDDTIIAAPDGRVAINELAASALATAGTGDVLAGAIGALLAGGADPFLAAAGGVYLHAHAGRIAAAALGTSDGVVAWDVAERLPAARGRTPAGRST
ncbi:MAG: NAD(P)H-hydrate dehydratase [Patulibacter sp.]